MIRLEWIPEKLFNNDCLFSQSGSERVLCINVKVLKRTQTEYNWEWSLQMIFKSAWWTEEDLGQYDPGKALVTTNEQIHRGSWQWVTAKWDSQSGNERPKKLITYLKLTEPKVKRYTQPWQVSEANLNSTLSTLVSLIISSISFTVHRYTTVSVRGMHQIGNRKAPSMQKGRQS